MDSLWHQDLGDVASIIDAGIYISEGDYGNALLAGAGLFMAVGSLTVASRAARNAKSAKNITPSTGSKTNHHSSTSCNSFDPETDVLMADGTTKDIAKVQVGDTVIATDPETGKQGPRTVTNTIEGEGDKTLVDITIDGNTITATDSHPFWNETTNTWTDAQHLKQGDKVQTATGTTATVDSVTVYKQHAKVNNLTIDDLHTYYVMAGNVSVLVHNAGGPECQSLINPPRLDGTGKVHGDIPGSIPRSWTREDLEELAQDLPLSISTRKARNAELGLDPGHARRLYEEEQLLRQVLKKLNGS